jgi:FMN phosphatase YigB (HAD superfamily)
MKYTHVLLDFDRTLNDSDLVFRKNLDGFLDLAGDEVLPRWEELHREVLTSEPKDRHDDLDFHLKILVERLAATSVEAAKDDLKARIKAAQRECWYATELFGEAIPFLSLLQEAGYVLHMATGDYARLKSVHLQRQAGRYYFDGMYDELVLGVGKGTSAYFDRIVERLDAPAETVVIIGDNLKNDISSGNEAGISTVWVRRKNEKNENGVKPGLTVTSLMEALPHFNGSV